MLYMLRLLDTEVVSDPLTGTKRIKETELVKCAKAQGQTDADLLQAASIPQPILDVGDEELAKEQMRRIAELKGYKHGPSRDLYHVSKQKRRGLIQGRELMEMLRVHIFADVCAAVLFLV